MENKTQWIGYKDLWNDIFKFLDINDYFNLELSNKNIRAKMLTYYQLKTKNLPITNIYGKNYKKIFFSKYFTSFVVYNIKEEGYNLLEYLDKPNEIAIEDEPNLKKNRQNKKDRKGSTHSNSNKEENIKYPVNNTNITSTTKVDPITSQSFFIDNTQTGNSMENSLFTQQ
jgi:hypothetical protein